jgi:hypothetical protein
MLMNRPDEDVTGEIKKYYAYATDKDRAGEIQRLLTRSS